MSENVYGLEINKDVISRIAGTAAIEVNGVAGLSAAPIKSGINIKNPIPGATSVLVHTDNGAMIIDIYINVYKTAKVRTVAEDVQVNVKENIQTMTGSPVALVNVHICDAVNEEDTAETEESK